MIDKRTEVSRRLWKAVGWTLPFATAGFLTPFIFKSVPTAHQAGQIAGSLFVLAAIWALAVARKHRYPLWNQLIFLLILALNALFWGWRFSNTVPMVESSLLGLGGGAWHGMLTALYLTAMLLLMIQEYRRARAN